MKITIELDNNEGRGELFAENGTMWCRRVSDGATWDTSTALLDDDLELTARALYGIPCWDLIVDKSSE